MVGDRRRRMNAGTIWSIRDPPLRQEARFRTRDERLRLLPTKNRHVALVRLAGSIREYENDSSSKRPASSVALAPRPRDGPHTDGLRKPLLEACQQSFHMRGKGARSVFPSARRRPCARCAGCARGSLPRSGRAVEAGSRRTASSYFGGGRGEVCVRVLPPRPGRRFGCGTPACLSTPIPRGVAPVARRPASLA